MKKSLICLLLAAVLLLLPAGALAEYDYASVTTPNMIVIDANDLTAASPIYEKASDAQIYPASTTKILTCILALENGNLDDAVTIGAEIQGHYELGPNHAYTENSSLMGLVEGETVTLRDLLYGLMLVSGNEAADSIAVKIGGTIENFIAMMNTKAAELGMTNSHFVTPNGVHDDQHYSTARDMAKLTAYALQNAQFRVIAGTDSYTVAANNVRTSELLLYNSNLMITDGGTGMTAYRYDKCIGVKTGLTTRAGSCLVAAAESDGACAIVCLYNDATTTPERYQRFVTSKAIFEDLFANVYMTASGSDLNLQSTFHCPVQKGRPEDLSADGTLEITVDPSALTVRALPAEINAMKSSASSVTAEVTWADSLSAPIRAGQWLGTVAYQYNGKTIFTLDLSAPSDVLEVAVVSSGLTTDDAGSNLPGSAGLLTSSEPIQTQPQSNGPSLIVYVLVGLGVIIAIFAVFALVSAAQQRKRKRERQLRRRQQQRQGGQRASSASGTRSGSTSPASGTRSGSAASRSGTQQHRSGGSSAQQRAASGTSASRASSASGARAQGGQQRTVSDERRRGNSPQTRYPRDNSRDR